MKPFYRSRKFVYAAATLLAALVVAILPMFLNLAPETIEMIEDMLPLVFVIGGMLITGHTVTDVAAVWSEGVQSKTLTNAAHDLVDVLAEAVPLGEKTPGYDSDPEPETENQPEKD